VFWPTFKSLILLFFLVSITWITEVYVGLWPSVGIALICIVVGTNRVEKYFQES